MDITWLGLACVRLKGRDATVLIDPYPRIGNQSMGKQTATIVLVSNHHPHHAYVEGVSGARLIDRPGEYEVAGVSIIGLNSRASEGTRNTIFVVDLDDVTVCHLGVIGVPPSAEQLEVLTGVDVLLAPAGSGRCLPVDQIVEIINQVEPKIVLPIYYRDDSLGDGLQPLDRFLKEWGVKEVERRSRLTVTKNSLPADTQVVVLTR